MDPKVNGRTNDKTQTLFAPRLFSVDRPPPLDDFGKLITETVSVQYHHASTIDFNIPIYTLPPYNSLCSNKPSSLQDEWYHILLSGPGVFVTKNLVTNTSLIDTMNAVFAKIIAQEQTTSGKRGDHFAGAGANDRIWNSFSKHCLADPKSFLEYYSNPWLPLISAAWLGPQHRLTAQVNIVKPGAKAQISHRDYHIGFQDNNSCAKFPKAMQVASQFLTLQGAVAHSDMPVESGPTRLLPFS